MTPWSLLVVKAYSPPIQIVHCSCMILYMKNYVYTYNLVPRLSLSARNYSAYDLWLHFSFRGQRSYAELLRAERESLGTRLNMYMCIPFWWELTSSKQPLSRDHWLVWPHHDSFFRSYRMCKGSWGPAHAIHVHVHNLLPHYCWVSCMSVFSSLRLSVECSDDTLCHNSMKPHSSAKKWKGPGVVCRGGWTWN